MKFVCAQPAIPYYTWQVEVMINNFIENGINPNDIHIVCSYYGKASEPWLKLKEHYFDVNFFFYPDTRKNASYISSIRPHILYKHWMANPELENENIFYHDCDIVFTKQVDFGELLNDDISYVSDTASYIGANYIRSKGEHYLDLMTRIVNIDKNKVIAEEKNSGGAQYILKNISAEFWNKVYYDSENLFRLVNDQILKDIAIDQGNHDIQIWCADMWAVLWNLWFFDKEVRVATKLNFSWSTSPISEWDINLIYHNAGVVDSNSNLFFKGAYIHKLPFDITIESFTDRVCSYNYSKEILKTKEKTCLLKKDIKKAAIFYTDNNNPHITKLVLETINKNIKDTKVITCSNTPIENNPFENLVYNNPVRCHENIIQKILMCLYHLRNLGEYDYVSFLEHDVLYPEGYLDYPNFKTAICNMNYIGIYKDGFQEKLPAQLPLHQMSMTLDFAIKNFEQKMLITKQQGWAFIEPDYVDQYQTINPAVHINHGKHFTSHFECYASANTIKNNYWGNYKKIWKKI